MAEIIFHPATQSAIEAAISNQTHALLLVAPLGAGKTTIANHIAKSHLGLKTDEQLANQAYFRRVGDTDPITVENIRDIKQFLSLKTTGDRDIRRVVIIERAETMNDESQNALLKSLEEPPLDTVIILNVGDIHGLRPTIRSRAQEIQIIAPTKPILTDYFTSQNYSAADIEKAYRMSGGLVGLMQAMLQDDNVHPLVIQIELAKELLAATSFERLTRVDSFAKERSEVALLVSAFKRICLSALEHAAAQGQEAATTRWYNTLRTVSETEAMLPRNPNLKLLLTDLFIRI